MLDFWKVIGSSHKYVITKTSICTGTKQGVLTVFGRWEKGWLSSRSDYQGGGSWGVMSIAYGAR